MFKSSKIPSVHTESQEMTEIAPHMKASLRMPLSFLKVKKFLFKRCGQIYLFKKYPFAKSIARMLILARNFAECMYLSTSVRKINIPERTIQTRLYNTTLARTDNVAISPLLSFLSLLKKENSRSDIKAAPMPVITLITCKTVA